MNAFPVKDILDYWFGDSRENAAALADASRRWFSGGAAVDQEIRQRYGDWIHLVGEAPPRSFTSPRELLAGVLVLDQFARQVYRGTAQAFAFDDKALALLDLALAKEWEGCLHPIERSFLYMPLQHVENAERQQQGVALFQELVEEAPEPYKETLGSNLKFARQHLAIIQRFGRFPHRNRALGRSSSEAEKDYMANGGARFGQ